MLARVSRHPWYSTHIYLNSFHELMYFHLIFFFNKFSCNFRLWVFNGIKYWLILLFHLSQTSRKNLILFNLTVLPFRMYFLQVARRKKLKEIFINYFLCRSFVGKFSLINFRMLNQPWKLLAKRMGTLWQLDAIQTLISLSIFFGLVKILEFGMNCSSVNLRSTLQSFTSICR